MLVQVAYAIGKADPVSINVDTFGTAHVALSDAEIAQRIVAHEHDAADTPFGNIFDLRPYAIEQRLKLRNPIYRETASYGHMGRTPHTVTKTFDGVEREVELFTWEKLDGVDFARRVFADVLA